MLIRSVLFALVTLIGLDAANAHGYKLGDLEIEHPWGRATPQGAKVGGGYFVIKNTGTAADRLVSVTSPEASDNVQLHEMAVNNGVMTMAPLPNGVAIPAGGTVAFKPGSYHVMFIDLKHPLKQGDHVKAKLTFERAGSVDVDFHIEAMGATGAPEHVHSMEGMSH